MAKNPLLMRSLTIAAAYGLVSAGYYYFFHDDYDLPAAALRGVVSAILFAGLYYLFTRILRRRFERRDGE